MPTTINAGASATISLSAEQIIIGRGPGAAVITSTQARFNQPLTAGDEWRIGPFDQARTVGITAGTADITYEVSLFIDPSRPAVVGDDGQVRDSKNGTPVSGGGDLARDGIVSIMPKLYQGTRYSANSSSFIMVGIKDGFVGVRFGFRNEDTAAAATITAKCCALPALTTDPKTVTPTTVTFGGASTGTIPQATTVTENGSTQTVAGYLLSDMIQLASVARTDVIGGNPLIYMRAASVEGLYYATKNSTLDNYIAAGYELSTGLSVNDGVANWATTAITATNFIGPCEIYAYSGGKTCGIAVFGDSLAAGVDDSINYPLAMSPLLAAAGLKAHVANHAQGGRFRSQFSGLVRRIVPILKPKIVIVHNYTVNSSVALNVEQQMAYLAGDIEAITQAGAKPIIVCMHGQVAAAQRTIAMYGDLYPVVDMNALLCSTYGTISDAYVRNVTTDRTHINDAACDVVGAACVAAIVEMV